MSAPTSANDHKMTVVTCFSYKGGAGRTVAAANIAAALASKEENVGAIKAPLNRKVAILDLDVFSAGTHRVFGIGNDPLKKQVTIGVQQYLKLDVQVSTYLEQGAVDLRHPLMEDMRDTFHAANYCRPDLTLFPAHADPGDNFVVQKIHENILFELVLELEKSGYDYLIIDGESGTRSMAEIALRLADVALLFFRPTWQHVEGTLAVARDWKNRKRYPKSYYLIPTCVPLISPEDHVYLEDAFGLADLRDRVVTIPEKSTLNFYADTECNGDGPGYFWANERRICVHDSLILKGWERITVFDTFLAPDRAAQDYYRIASEIDARHGPTVAANMSPSTGDVHGI